MYIQNQSINGIVKQEDPIDIMPKFNIFDADQPDIYENITEEIKGSPLNHTEWIIEKQKMQKFVNGVFNVTTIIQSHEPLEDYLLRKYDEMLWPIDKLKKIIPDVNWDKIFMGLFGRTNVTDKIFVVDLNFAHKINDVIKNVDKRWVLLK